MIKWAMQGRPTFFDVSACSVRFFPPPILPITSIFISFIQFHIINIAHPLINMIIPIMAEYFFLYKPISRYISRMEVYNFIVLTKFKLAVHK